MKTVEIEEESEMIEVVGITRGARAGMESIMMTSGELGDSKKITCLASRSKIVF